MTVKKLYNSDFFIRKDYKTQQKLAKSTNCILIFERPRIHSGQTLYISIVQKGNFDRNHSELDFLRKTVMKIN